MHVRLELAQITQRLGRSDAGTTYKVLEPAQLPTRPVSPNLWLFFFASLVAGLTLGSALAFGLEYLDESFHTDEEIQGASGLPVLGMISTITTKADLASRWPWHLDWSRIGRPLQRLTDSFLRPALVRIDTQLVKWGL